jgi:hypothetical protein
VRLFRGGGGTVRKASENFGDNGFDIDHRSMLMSSMLHRRERAEQARRLPPWDSIMACCSAILPGNVDKPLEFDQY